jgi:hypothetical protein
MSMIDINNLPTAPDSDLDSDTSIQGVFTIADSTQQSIALGDFVDVTPDIFTPDPEWGLSYQCIGLDVMAQELTILVKNGANYDPTQLSAAAITNNYRRVPRE